MWTTRQLWEHMIIEGGTLANGSRLRTDVCVVGAGPAGLTVASRLADAGHDVLVIEGGGRHHTRADNDTLRGSGSGSPIQLVRSRQCGFGGTSGHWQPHTGLRIRPLDPIDFASRPGRATSWPFGRNELDRYYRESQDELAIPYDYDELRWRNDGTTSIVWPDGPELATFHFAEHDVFVRRYEEFAASSRVNVALHTSCHGIALGHDGATVTHLDVVGPQGGRAQVAARAFVLAAGGIDNARLLLASPGRSGAGVGNEHDNVGRYFMDHLAVDTGRMIPLDDKIGLEVFRVRRRSPIYRSQSMLWLGNDRLERDGLLNAAFVLTEVDPAYLSVGVGAVRSLRAARHSSPHGPLLPHVRRAVGDPIGVATFARRSVLRRRPRVASISMRIFTEQAPDRNSRVTLGGQRDARGIPRVDVDWRISSGDLDLIRAHQDSLSLMLEAKGVARVDDRFDAGHHASPVMPMYHHIGTTRMHSDPRHGVVDAASRVHSTTNLYVTGSSVFSTGGYINPTLTIIALARRLAVQVAHDIGPTTVRREASTG